MLLIGSRAARFHFPSARKPRDFDFIATSEEVEGFLKNFNYKDTSKHQKKIRALVDLHGEKASFEFDLTTAYRSSFILHECDRVFEKDDCLLGTKYYVASPLTLFLLKRSHITFPIHFEKNIEDYLFLKKKVEQDQYPTWWNYTFRLRFKEIKERGNRKQMNFDVDNSEFFRKSEKFVQRIVEHDSLHYATCFGDKPLFLSAKEDLNKAALAPRLVQKLSFEDKIKLMQEECMALALERHIIPAMIKGEYFDSKMAYKKIACKMVYNYLPSFLRFFAADHFHELLDLKVDYVNECLNRHKDLKSIILQLRLPLV